MFGKSYINAAKDAWRLLKDRGIDALINDSLGRRHEPRAEVPADIESTESQQHLDFWQLRLWLFMLLLRVSRPFVQTTSTFLTARYAMQLYLLAPNSSILHSEQHESLCSNTALWSVLDI